ncbi:uncharacterized protein LOC127705177 [Mytilus californianus]|uniref:uncharacterized protein LOC127705177 n=1 Tax=Mytilus californianus TaxID=6549 RepID=UPI002246ED11|nr:uncharacterized protein LOC127705177 [Mytilus californianus]
MDNLDSKHEGQIRKRTRSTSKDVKYAEPSEKTSLSVISTLTTDDRKRKRKTTARLDAKSRKQSSEVGSGSTNEALNEKRMKIASFEKTNTKPIVKLSLPSFSGGHSVLRAAGLPRPSSPPHLTKDKLKIPTLAEVIKAADDKPVVWALPPPPPPPDPPNPN